MLFLNRTRALYHKQRRNVLECFYQQPAPVAVHYIDLQPRTNDLVLGTHGRGIIIIDDISPLRTIGEEQLQSKLYFFEPSGMVMRDKSAGFVEYFGTETQFVGENPNRIAQFKYILPKRHTFGKMTMEVTDMKGNKVATLNPKNPRESILLAGIIPCVNPK